MASLRRFGLWMSRLPGFATFVRRFGSRFERIVYRITKGRVTPSGWIAPVLLLSTKGRRSGRERTTPLMYVRDGANFVVSCENFGGSRPSAWPLNLDADTHARVQVGSEVFECRARRLSEEEADRYWPALVESYPGHAVYRERSGVRHTFILEPEPSR